MSMQIAILGPLSVTSVGGPVAVGGARLRALLIRLAVDTGRQVSVAALADALWHDVPADPPNAVQSLVYRLRRVLPDPAVLCRVSGGYRLNLPADALDATRFEQLAAEGGAALRSGESRAAAALLGTALDLWRGPALVDVADARYAAPIAGRLEELRLSAEEDWLGARLAGGHGRSLVPRLEELTAAHPLRERPVAMLIEALVTAGRGADALGAFDRFRLRLAGELGLDPSPELRRLHLAVLRGDLRISARTAPPGNLRAALTSFVGRDAERARLARRLAGSRLVTVVGPGGVGKTRLAVTGAAALPTALPGGIWLADLAAVTDGAGVVDAVVDAVIRRPVAPPGGSPGPPAHGWARLVELFSGPPALLLLDNCEHVGAAVAGLAEELLGRCPGLRILATGREPLRLAGEALCPVPPLESPAPWAGPAEALRYPAVRLFADRGEAVRPGFVVDGTTVAAVVQICRRLDGLPLAIELAAARLRTLSPARIVAGLDDRFRLLAGCHRTALPRHRSLRSAVAWSWDLLGHDERVLARRLAVFPATVTAASAEQVCADRALPAHAVAELLDALTGRSLLDVDDKDVPGYRMLHTTRAYAWQQLCDAGEQAALRVAYARHARVSPCVRGAVALRGQPTPLPPAG